MLKDATNIITPAIFFSGVIILCSFFINNMIVAPMVDNYDKILRVLKNFTNY